MFIKNLIEQITLNKGVEMTGGVSRSSLLIVAITILSALAAPAAQASSLDAGAQPGVLIGSNEGNVALSVTSTSGNPFNTTCKSASLEATTQGQAIQELTVTPTYSECTLAGLAAQILMNGCKYTLTGSGQAANTVTTDIVGCTAGKAIEIKSALCTFQIGEQAGVPHDVFTNVGILIPHVILHFTKSKVKVKQVGVACPDGPAHESTNASMTGTWTIKLFQLIEDFIIVQRHGHQYGESKAGSQVSIQTT